MFQAATEDSLKEEWELGRTLGSGTFSVVREAKNKMSGDRYAIKVIDKSNIDVNSESLKTEVDILQSVKHPHIVNLFRIYETKKKVYLVMEILTGGELFDRIVNEFPNGYSEKDAARLIKKIVDAMKYLHQRGIVHRDLKPENLLYQNPHMTSDIKITDFGLAKLCSGSTMLKTACGTPNYVAPEVLKQNGYGKSVDMWSIGVILYILLCGFPPFYHENTAQLFDMILAGKFEFPHPYWSHISASAKDLISRLLRVDPEKRLTCEQVLSHPWVKGVDATDGVMPDVVSEMKRFNRKGRFKMAAEAVIAAQRLLNNLKLEN